MTTRSAGRLLALLIGVTSYVDDGIDDLSFIDTDLDLLKQVLERASFIVNRHPTSACDLSGIDSAIEIFLQEARPGDRTIIFLSGHGIHSNGIDYLVPAGALLRSHDFASKCLPIKFDQYIERSKASAVTVFVDACREGVHMPSKDVSHAIGWSNNTVELAVRRQVSYIYACSPGERARYVSNGLSSFSLFSRAICEVLAESESFRNLRLFQSDVQARLETLAASNDIYPQRIRILTENVLDDYYIGREQSALSATANSLNWKALSGDNALWQPLQGQRSTEQFRELAMTIAQSLQSEGQSLAEDLKTDPWFDVSFARRMNERLRWMLSTMLNPEKLSLASGEALVISVAPFIYQQYWASRLSLALKRLDDDPTTMRLSSADSSSLHPFNLFARGYARLTRRHDDALSGGSVAAPAIWWWLFRRWVRQNPLNYKPDSFTNFMKQTLIDAQITDPIVWEILDPAAVGLILRLVPGDLSDIYRSETGARLDRRLVGASTSGEQSLRDPLLAALLSVAHKFSIEVDDLPEIIVDHIAVPGGVQPNQVMATISSAAWWPRGRTRVLLAKCEHPAIDLALREQADRVNSVLSQTDECFERLNQTEPLLDLPIHATSDGVEADVQEDGAKAYDSVGFRFRLADDRIQDLLMGEQLYGEPDLALRELYQNALDACRYRRSRLEYLEACGEASAGENVPISINLTQGIDETGRAYIECQDTGVGMGMRELVEVFSHAGVRFADLPEFAEEQAEWSNFNIYMYPNSRFGIGVLSYFMLADQITVTTSRMHRDGSASETLRVHIAGPGALLRVQQLDEPSRVSGTTVRLHLRDTASVVSCTEFLSRQLWIAEFPVSATNDGVQLRWEPNVLSPQVDDMTRQIELGRDPINVGDSRGRGRLARRVDISDLDIDEDTFEYGITATRDPDIWWTPNRNGAILVDGLWVNQLLTCAIVNLRGKNAPRLTIDRRQVLNLELKFIQDVLRSQFDLLIRDDWSVNVSWMRRLCSIAPDLADSVALLATSKDNYSWIVGRKQSRANLIGCFPSDATILAREATVSEAGVFKFRSHETGPHSENRHVLSWRFISWIRAGYVPGVRLTDRGEQRFGNLPLAQPSDEIVLSPLPLALYREASEYRSEDPTKFSRSHVIAAAAVLQRPAREVVNRLQSIGCQLEDEGDWTQLPDQLEQSDAVILSVDLDGRPRYLPSDKRVSLGHVFSVRRIFPERTTAEIAERLCYLGLDVDDVHLGDNVGSQEVDPRLLATTGESGPPWLNRGDAVHPLAIIRVVRLTDSSLESILDSLRKLGLQTPKMSLVPDTVGLRMAASLLDYATQMEEGEFLPLPEFVPTCIIWIVAVEFERPISTVIEVAQRLDMKYRADQISPQAGIEIAVARVAVLWSNFIEDGSPNVPVDKCSVPQFAYMATALPDIAPRVLIEALSTIGVDVAPGLDLDRFTLDHAAIVSSLNTLRGAVDNRLQLAQVLWVAQDVRREVAHVLEIFTTHGLTCPALDTRTIGLVTLSDLNWLSLESALHVPTELSGRFTEFLPDPDLLNRAIPSTLIGVMAGRCGLSVDDMVQRLLLFGYACDDVTGLCSDPSRDEAALVSRFYRYRHGSESVIDAYSAPVDLGEAIYASRVLSLDFKEVVTVGHRFNLLFTDFVQRV